MMNLKIDLDYKQIAELDFPYKTFSLRLARLRKKLGITQTHLGELLGVSRISISLWEKGTRVPKTEYIYMISNICDVSIDYLMGFSDTSKNNDDNLYIKKILRDNKIINDENVLDREKLDFFLRYIETLNELHGKFQVS